MIKNYLYYLVTGDPILSKIKAFQEESVRLSEIMREFCDRFGAVGSFGSSSGTKGLEFGNNPIPEGWVREVHKGKEYYRPRAKPKSTLLREMQMLRQADHLLFQEILTGNRDAFAYMGQDLCGYFIGLDYIGEHPILQFPVPECGFAQKGRQMVMPDTGVELLDEARYYQLKADAATAKAKKAKKKPAE